MASRLKIKIGAVEVEYEGEEKFLKEEIPALLKAVSDLHKVTAPSGHEDVKGGDRDDGAKIIRQKATTPSAVAAKLKCDSGTQLVLATSYSLSTSGHSTFSRQQITDGMRSAAPFFRQTFLNNLSKYLGQLVKSGDLNPIGTDQYSLSSKAQDDIGRAVGH